MRGRSGPSVGLSPSAAPPTAAVGLSAYREGSAAWPVACQTVVYRGLLRPADTAIALIIWFFGKSGKKLVESRPEFRVPRPPQNTPSGPSSHRCTLALGCVECGRAGCVGEPPRVLSGAHVVERTASVGPKPFPKHIPIPVRCYLVAHIFTTTRESGLPRSSLVPLGEVRSVREGASSPHHTILTLRRGVPAAR